jgi:hypothetical protein
VAGPLAFEGAVADAALAGLGVLVVAATIERTAESAELVVHGRGLALHTRT